MKRRFHWSLPAGFLLVLAAMLTVPIFTNIPATRDFAWLNLLLLAAGTGLLLISLVQAIRQPQLYRGKILGGILATLSLVALGIFVVGIFYFGRIPQPATVHKAGEKAPEFSLLDQEGKRVTLQDVLGSPQTKGALLIFYRGYW